MSRRPHRLRTYILRRALHRAFAHPCGNLVPRSGDEGERTYCFVVYVNINGGKPYLVLDSLNGDVVRCRRSDGRSFNIEIDENLQNLVDGELQFIHYDGLYRTDYSTAWGFYWRQYTGVDYIRIRIHRWWNSSIQFLFNKRTLRSEKLLRILRLLVHRRLSGHDKGVTSMDVMTELYSDRWWDHPSRDARESEIEFQLEALLFSKDLEKRSDEIGYRATPQALRTLEEIDEQERRHTETSRLQVWIIILTFIMAVAAIAQTLVDWIKK